MLGISTRFLVVWDDGSEYLKTMYFILLVRWQKPRIVYPEHLVLGSEKYPCVGKLMSICLMLNTILLSFQSQERKSASA